MSDTGVFDVAVVIVNWNSGAMLSRCLEHIQNQTLPAKRVMVMDNNSSDDSLSQAMSRFPMYEFHQMGDNLGFAAANNRAVELADDCQWIALINPDAYAEKYWLEALHKASIENSGYDAFASLMLDYENPEIVDGAGDVYHTSGLAWRRYHGRKIQDVSLISDDVFAPCGGAALYKRAAFLEAGMFEESFYCYFEDVDLGFRMQLMGYKCLFIPEARVAHIGSAITGTISGFALYYGHRNLEWCFFKNMPTSLLFLYLPFHLFINLVSLIYFSLKGKPMAILKAKYNAFSNLGMALKNRKSIERKRTVSSGDLRKKMARGLSFIFSR